MSRPSSRPALQPTTAHREEHHRRLVLTGQDVELQPRRHAPRRLPAVAGLADDGGGEGDEVVHPLLGGGAPGVSDRLHEQRANDWSQRGRARLLTIPPEYPAGPPAERGAVTSGRCYALSQQVRGDTAVRRLTELHR